jgi:hypothetical protein
MLGRLSRLIRSVWCVRVKNASISDERTDLLRPSLDRSSTVASRGSLHIPQRSSHSSCLDMGVSQEHKAKHAIQAVRRSGVSSGRV